MRRLPDVLAMVSHEMSAPIAAIAAGTESLKSGALKRPRDAARIVRILERQTLRLQEFLADLIDAAGADGLRRPGAAEAVDLRAAIGLTVRDVRGLAREKRVGVRFASSDDIVVSMDRCQLAQVLRNIVHNAVKYSHRRGRVTVSAARVGRRARVSVSDRGIGISPREMKTLFRRFKRTPSARSHAHGSGLGLYIVRRILTAHGCRTWARSVAGRGTTFFVTLPLA